MYDWDYVVDQYEHLFATMAGKPVPERQSAVKKQAQSSTDEVKTMSRSA
jgi:hypothetical protein